MPFDVRDGTAQGCMVLERVRQLYVSSYAVMPVRCYLTFTIHRACEAGLVDGKCKAC